MIEHDEACCWARPWQTDSPRMNTVQNVLNALVKARRDTAAVHSSSAVIQPIQRCQHSTVEETSKSREHHDPLRRCFSSLAHHRFSRLDTKAAAMVKMLDKFLGKSNRNFNDSGGPLQFSATQDRVASLEKQVCCCHELCRVQSCQLATSTLQQRFL